MESLAMLVVIIMLGIIGCGLVALVIALKSPEKTWARAVATAAAVPAVAAGGWLAILDVGIGARVIGALVMAAGLLAVLRTWRRR
ncbi:MAG: hypothetical protein ACO28P_08600 [Ilumatobacteraceae bacterium]